MEHYAEKKYPLAVKLGTITPDGKADVFSYAEDAMVSDPYLAKHLAHFGINITSLTKVGNLIIDLKVRYLQFKVQECPLAILISLLT